MTRAFVDPDEVNAAPTRRGFVDPDAPQAATATVSAPQTLRDKAISAYAAVPEAMATLGTGAVGAVAGGFAGLAQGAKNLVSPGMPAGDRVRQVQEALTYQPRTAGGQAVTQAAAYLPEKLAEGADYVGGNVAEATGSPALGAGVNTALQAAPQLLARGLKAPVQRMAGRAETKAADLKSINSVRDTTINDARALDYKFPPTEVRDSYGAARVESMGGKAAIGQQMNRHNQTITDRIGREEAGLKPNEPISLETLDKAKTRIAQPYRELEALSTKAATAFEDLKTTRLRAKEQWDFFHRNGDPAIKAKAQAFNAEATRLEGVIDTEAVAAGVPGLPARVKQARIELAKNYDVERALNLGDGHLDARVWGRMLDHEKPLTGKLKVAARAAEAMSRYMKSAESVPTPGVSKTEMMSSALLGLGGHAALGPGGVALAAAPFIAPPIARAVASSRLMQRPNVYGPGSGVGALSTLTQYPNAYAVSPALGGILSQLQEQ